MIIIGVKDRARTVDHGTFTCPHCQSTRPFEKKRSKLYFSLFFVPILPLKELGEFIECQHCMTRYSVDILTRPHPSSAIKHRIPAVKADLESGTPLEMARQKLINEGYAPGFAGDLVEEAVGDHRQHCPDCRLTYSANNTFCAVCGGRLSPL